MKMDINETMNEVERFINKLYRKGYRFGDVQEIQHEYDLSGMQACVIAHGLKLLEMSDIMDGDDSNEYV